MQQEEEMYQGVPHICNCNLCSALTSQADLGSSDMYGSICA